MPLGLGATLGIGGGRSSTSSGAPSGGGGAPFANTKSVSFDGVDDYGVSIPGILPHTTNYSGSFWFKAPSLPSSTVGLFANQNGAQFYLYANGNILVSRATGSYWGLGGHKYINGLVSADTWYHFAWTKERNSDGAGGWNNPTMDYYFNGSSQGALTNRSDASGVLFDPDVGGEEGLFWVGAGYNVSGNNAACLIDEFALWDTLLSPAQVTNIYRGEESGGSGGTNGTAGDLSTFNPRNWYRMGDGTEAGSGTTVYDMGSAGGGTTDMTLTNNPTYSTDVPS